jgi:6-phosphogluconolactonase
LIGEIQVVADAAALAETGARRVLDTAARVLATRARCRLVLSGGSTPRALYERLAAASAGARGAPTAAGAADAIDWSRVELYFGDERCVPADDPASNFRMVRESLLDRLPCAPAAVHRIEGERPAPEAAERYARRIAGAADEASPPRFDLVLLGLGEDGHTASLFPGSPALEEATRTVVAARAPVAPHERVTMTLPVLRAARAILFLVSGAAKSAVLARVLDAGGERRAAAGPPLPAARVMPESGHIAWLVDRAAAAALERGATS